MAKRKFQQIFFCRLTLSALDIPYSNIPLPDEYRLDEQLKNLGKILTLSVDYVKLYEVNRRTAVLLL